MRVFRSDDTSLWAELFGSASNGVHTISSNVNSSSYSNYTNVTAGTAAGFSLTLGTSGNPGFFNAGQPCVIFQTQGSGVGNYELNVIANNNGFVSGGGAITTKYPLINTYGAGAQIWNLAQFSGFTVNNGFTLSAPLWDGTTGGIIPILCNGAITIAGGISVNGAGFRGGAGSNRSTTSATSASQGEGTIGVGGVATAANGNGGGGAAGGLDGGSGGGGGGNSATGSNGVVGQNGAGTGGALSGSADLTSLVFGGGGGGGSGESNTGNGSGTGGGSGGAGGGIILLIGKSITITGSITANGAVGGDGINNWQEGSGGGGGGSGGSILLKSQIETLGSNLVTASLGNGGAFSPGGTASGNGGNGSAGRIHTDYSSFLSGTTSPSLDLRVDAYLNSSGAGFAGLL